MKGQGIFVWQEARWQLNFLSLVKKKCIGHAVDLSCIFYAL